MHDGESLALLDTILATAPIGLAFFNLQLRFVRINHALAEINGLPCEDHIGHTVQEVLPGLPAQVTEDLETVLRTGEPILDREVSGLTPKSPRRRFWLASYYPVRLRTGELRGVGAVVAEITGRMQAEQDRSRLMDQLRDALRARDDFLSMAAHDLKNPLTTLKLKLSSVVRSAQRGIDCQLSDGALGKLVAADEQVDRMVLLINKLLDFSKIGAGRVKLEVEHLDLSQLCREVAERSQEELLPSGSTLHVAGDQPVWGYWDRMRLDQVVTNLLSNAIKYGAGKPIELQVDGQGERPRIVVRDQGIGIAPEDQERIFERFERADAERQHGSFGLGLWIVRRILDSMEGTIQVESKLGEGTTFTVELPWGKPQSVLIR